MAQKGIAEYLIVVLIAVLVITGAVLVKNKIVPKTLQTQTETQILLKEEKAHIGSQTISPTTIEKETGGGVPLPSDEDIIRSFVDLIENGEASGAALMMKTKNETELQTWAVHFNAIKSFKLLKIEKTNEDQWTDNKHIYKVVLDVWMDPSSADAPIPYYGWQNGENTRWITLEKVGDIWKIAEIATGP
jgi:hypothetical protein